MAGFDIRRVEHSGSSGLTAYLVIRPPITC
jgi:hypothetical protein